jgi:hypothetical protein
MNILRGYSPEMDFSFNLAGVYPNPLRGSIDMRLQICSTGYVCMAFTGLDTDIVQ